MNLKDGLKTLADHLAELEAKARTLPNQNLADQIEAAKGKILQALDHPDVPQLDAAMRGEEFKADDPNALATNSGGNAMFAAGDPGRILKDQEAARRDAFPTSAQSMPAPAAPGAPFPLPAAGMPAAPFPGTTEGGAPVRDTSKLDPDAKHPGDPKFVKPNDGFADPNAANLNEDGTLKTAPNSLGTTDDRDGKKQDA